MSRTWKATKNEGVSFEESLSLVGNSDLSGDVTLFYRGQCGSFVKTFNIPGELFKKIVFTLAHEKLAYSLEETFRRSVDRAFEKERLCPNCMLSTDRTHGYCPTCGACMPLDPRDET